MKVDPITFAVIKSGLDSIADDMAYTVVRIARSEIVKDVMDFSAALCAADGQMVAQAKTIAQHLGAIPEAMAAVLAKFGDDLNDGDAVIMNDPYHGGMHLPDIFMFMPLFFERQAARLRGGDLPPHRRRRPRAGLERVGLHRDLPGRPAHPAAEAVRPRRAQRDAGDADQDQRARAGPRAGATSPPSTPPRRSASAGSDKLLAALRRRRGRSLHERAARLCRAADARGDQDLAEGHATRFTDHIDSDGFSDTPIPIKVAITVRDDGTLLVDYTGSSPQVKGALNSTLSFTHSLTYLSVRCVLPKDVPNNVGFFRCIEVKAPEASVLNPVMPGPCAARALTGYRVFDTMLGALAQIVPERVPAAGEGGNSVICISGLRPNRKPFIIVDMICGAWGGRPDKDGLEAVTNASQNLSNMPVEVMEAEHPVRVEEYAFVPDTCGAGQWRGGVGVAAHLSHPGARGAAADAHRPRRVRSPTAWPAASRAAARATSSRSATAASRCRAR